MDETQKPTQPQAPAAPELTVTDLNNVRSILDVAVRRGAFGANELTSIGAVYDKLSAFLNAVAAQKPEDKAPEVTQ